MSQEKIFLDVVNKAADLIEAMDQEKKSSSHITRHKVMMKKRELNDAVFLARRLGTQLAAPKLKIQLVSSNQRYLGR